MTAAPLDVDRPGINRSQQRAGPTGNRAGLEIGKDMKSKRGIGPGICVEQSILDHMPRAGVSLFTGLEHEFNSAGQLVAMAVKQMHGLNEHGGVGIMAARV